jgi:hypothetical protein
VINTTHIAAVDNERGGQELGDLGDGRRDGEGVMRNLKKCKSTLIGNKRDGRVQKTGTLEGEGEKRKDKD